jgi:acetolactate synthase-1/2/3 large subunit
MSIHSSAEKFLTELLTQNFEELDYSKWLSVLTIWKERYPSYNLNPKETNANDFLHTISNYISDNAIICADVGQNQMCAAQSIKLDNNRRFLNSAGYGSMGFSLPAAIGAAYARKNTDIVSINGDGGIQMNIQELQTIVRDNLPINIIILNNNCLGMIRRLQEKMFGNRTFGSIKGYSTPNYSKIAAAYGIKYLKIDNIKKYELAKDFISNKEPRFIELVLPREMQNIPEPGVSISKQTPLLSDEELELIKKESLI